MRKSSKISCLLLSIMLQLCACSENNLIRNPQLDRWCGERPCEWEVDGPIQRVGSWHPNDYAIQLLEDARLSQVNGTADDDSASCLEFSLVSKLTSDTRVFLELDFLNDGSIDFSQRLPVSDWEKHTFRITAPVWYRGVTFILRKESGSTPAIVAELSATSTGREHCTAPPVVLRELPEGATCTTSEDCGEGLCVNRVCGGCSTAADCGNDEVCGLYYRNGLQRHVCGPKQNSALGELCDIGDQCQSGICTNFACSECKTDVDCTDGASCDRAIFLVPGYSQPAQNWPSMCDPGSQKRRSSEPCINNVDCQSLDCEGGRVDCKAIPNCGLESGNSLCSFTCSTPLVVEGTCR